MLKHLASLLHYYAAKTISSLKYALKKKKTAADISGQVTKLDPLSIPKFVNQLVKPPVYKPFEINMKEKSEKLCKKTHLYFIDISQFKEQILPNDFPETTVWGYGGLVRDPETGSIKYSRSAPGATFEAIRDIPVRVKWINRLKESHLFAVDPTLHWANPNGMPMEPPKPWPPFPPGFPEAQRPVPIVTHLHGGEVPSIYDGHPDAWFTYNGKKGPAFVTNMYTYPNKQEPTTLWYHDHALGITRLNVYAGLAGFYLLRDSENCSEKKFSLPMDKYEIPIVIQDRSFNTDGSLWFNKEGINPEIHPYWVPEFFGDTIMVNGKVWPNLDVERRQYRFRLLNGSSARFYNLKMSNGTKFMQIGTDGGFLPKPVERDTLLIAPGERADILVDFSNSEPGTSIILLNDANAPFPDGDAPDPATTGQIMQFTVPADAAPPVKPPKLPDNLNKIPDLIPDSPQRILTLNEVAGPNGPVAVLLNGQKWEAPISELPRVGSTEEWVIANLTMDTHPIHLHLVQFQLFNRQDFMAEDYRVKWEEINGVPPLDHPTEVIPVEPYLNGEPIEPDDNEKGWKDTIRMNPNQVTRIKVRFAPQAVPASAAKPGENLYSFDPTVGPGYVWHCHILDHEDNEMMRPYKVNK
ncbi:MAG: multicopper oxidase [Bacillota bacterium]|nr:multicopper oxidase [Bacillota bacterium]